jgi:hypothetical protein
MVTWRRETGCAARSRRRGSSLNGSRRLVRLWPWRASVIAWLLVVIPVGLVRGHFSGIYGFSTANYGWFAFTLVGGSGLAWRLAGTPPVIQAAPGGMT